MALSRKGHLYLGFAAIALVIGTAVVLKIVAPKLAAPVGLVLALIALFDTIRRSRKRDREEREQRADLKKLLQGYSDENMPTNVSVPTGVSEEEAMRVVKQQFADAGAFECSDGLARNIVRQARGIE